MLHRKSPPQELLRNLLDRTDRFAVETVKAGQGGPFGASIHIYEPALGKTLEIGGLAANAVLSKGMASAHAENEVISPENVAELIKQLQFFNPNTVQVILSSSGQSCPACTAKEEILARYLIAKNLILPGNFFVTYGATYRDTKEIAEFDDEPYKLDMGRPAHSRKIRLNSMKLASTPADIQKIFKGASAPVTIIYRKGQILSIGHDLRRVSGDMMATAEVSAIRAASLAAKDNGKDEPWNLLKATLFTPAVDIGPMAYAEGQWSNLKEIVSVTGLSLNQQKLNEASKISNTALFNIVASPDDKASDVITIIKIEPFKNRAQYAWRELLRAQADPSKILYNGIK